MARRRIRGGSEGGTVLDRSAFYPGGGGQPPDHGVLLWGGVQTLIVDTRRRDDRWLVPLDGDPLPPVGTVVTGAIEDERRTALMRTHSGLHLLSEVVFRDFHALVARSNMDPLSGRLDFDLDEVAIPDVIRTASNLLPPTIQIVRIVDISDLDVQADGGTNVASTRQIGAIRVVKVESKGKGFRRIRIALDA